jgi:hypothetical protein
MRYRVRVRTWLLEEVDVEVDASDDKDARALAISCRHSVASEPRTKRKSIQTVIIKKGGPFPGCKASK